MIKSGPHQRLRRLAEAHPGIDHQQIVEPLDLHADGALDQKHRLVTDDRDREHMPGGFLKAPRGDFGVAIDRDSRERAIIVDDQEQSPPVVKRLVDPLRTRCWARRATSAA
jgi:hypothetical protein